MADIRSAIPIFTIMSIIRGDDALPRQLAEAWETSHDSSWIGEYGHPLFYALSCKNTAIANLILRGKLFPTSASHLDIPRHIKEQIYIRQGGRVRLGKFDFGSKAIFFALAVRFVPGEVSSGECGLEYNTAKAIKIGINIAIKIAVKWNENVESLKRKINNLSKMIKKAHMSSF